MTVLPATDTNIERAARALRSGNVVAFPTETVYGLGADATNGEAVATIFEIKGRPRFNPLIVHVADLQAARQLADFPLIALQAARNFWPGALTLVLQKLPDSPISDLATAGLDTVAVRVPAHPVAARLLRSAKIPVAAPSANRSGHVSPTTALHVEEDLGDAPSVILDGGPTPLGIESTVVELASNTPRLLRPGAVAREDLEAVLGAPLKETAASALPTSPGQLESHYAPRAKLRLGAHTAREGEALLAFGPDAPASSGLVRNLSRNGDLREAAANLFSALRDLDATGSPTIAVMPIPDTGLGEAINDRLQRGAAER